MDFHEFILFFVFLPLQTRAEGWRKGQSRFRGTSWSAPFAGAMRLAGQKWRLGCRSQMDFSMRADEAGGAEVALGMPLPDELQQES